MHRGRDPWGLPVLPTNRRVVIDRAQSHPPLHRSGQVPGTCRVASAKEAAVRVAVMARRRFVPEYLAPRDLWTP